MQMLMAITINGLNVISGGLKISFVDSHTMFEYLHAPLDFLYGWETIGNRIIPFLELSD